MASRASGGSPTIEIHVGIDDPVSVAADTLVVAVPPGDAEWQGPLAALDSALDGQLRETLDEAGFTGSVGSTFTLPTMGRISARRIVATGLAADDMSAEDLRQAYGCAATAAKRAGGETVACLPPGGGLDATDAYRAAVEGMLLALYDFRVYRSGNGGGDGVSRWWFLDADGEAIQEGIRIGTALAAGVYLARDLTFEPGNTIYPETLAEIAREVATSNELEYREFDENQLAEMGAGATVAVGQGSVHPPRLVHMTYTPAGTSRGTIALVGKGITFDTGGMTLKTGSGMVPMKTDMAGAAAVLGAMRAIAALDLPYTVHGIIAAAENMPSGTAYRPSDVLTALNGKTIEVISTDAEGRLVLADALVYAARLGSEEMIDLATLTGSKVTALGSESVAVFSNDNAMADAVVAAGTTAGEQFWHMPLWTSLRKQLDSETADLKNTGGRAGGSITAALFLSEFTEGVIWTHLDIAGAAWASSARGYTPKGATGVGVRSLVNYLEQKAAGR